MFHGQPKPRRKGRLGNVGARPESLPRGVIPATSPADPLVADRVTSIERLKCQTVRANVRARATAVVGLRQTLYQMSPCFKTCGFSGVCEPFRFLAAAADAGSRGKPDQCRGERQTF